MKKHAAILVALLVGGAAAFAQMPIGGEMGPGPVISAPGSPSGLGEQNPPPQMGPGPVINAPGSQAGIGNQQPAQMPVPGPGIGNGPDPAPGSGIYNPGTPPPVQPPLANPGAPGPLAPLVVGPPLSSPNWQNAGTITVIACGTDAQGVWRTIPLRVSYVYNGAQYNVTVDSAWNPWTDCWNYGVDVPAFNTYYFLNGNYYNFYVNLSTGTFYFNL